MHTHTHMCTPLCVCVVCVYCIHICPYKHVPLTFIHIFSFWGEKNFFFVCVVSLSIIYGRSYRKDITHKNVLNISALYLQPCYIWMHAQRYGVYVLWYLYFALCTYTNSKNHMRRYLSLTDCVSKRCKVIGLGKANVGGIISQF